MPLGPENTTFTADIVQLAEGGAWVDVLDATFARAAVNRCLGTDWDRKITSLGHGSWEVEFTYAEAEMIKTEGFLDLADGPYEMCVDYVMDHAPIA